MYAIHLSELSFFSSKYPKPTIEVVGEKRMTISEPTRHSLDCTHIADIE